MIKIYLNLKTVLENKKIKNEKCTAHKWERVEP